MAYDREAFKLRGENARLNFPEMFLNKDKNEQVEEEPSSPVQDQHEQKPVPVSRDMPREESNENDSGIGSSDATVSDEVHAAAASAEGGDGVSQELVWGEMSAWFNAIPAAWGPGSPVWDDLDPTNNLLYQSHVPFSNSNQQEMNDASDDAQRHEHNTGSGYLWKDQD